MSWLRNRGGRTNGISSSPDAVVPAPRRHRRSATRAPALGGGNVPGALLRRAARGSGPGDRRRRVLRPLRGRDRGRGSGACASTARRRRFDRCARVRVGCAPHTRAARFARAATRKARPRTPRGKRRRRRGEYAEAADLHTRALHLLRDIDNPHAVALTQNNLALALSHVGDDREAISLFEEAAATLHTLGDQENEGKIMANLALAHRRHGRTDESADVLRTALTKLERDSGVYELVEAELSRAS